MFPSRFPEGPHLSAGTVSLGDFVMGQDLAFAFAERHEALSAHCDEVSLNSSIGLQHADSFPQFDFNRKLAESSGTLSTSLVKVMNNNYLS